MAQQTAVEWLIEQYTKKGYIGMQDELQAKQMEKDQITDSYWDGGQDVPSHISACENYYNETFKK